MGARKLDTSATCWLVEWASLGVGSPELRLSRDRERL
jgi:hypothetical protein